MREYILAVFSLRTSTMQFFSLLKKNNVRCFIVETPKSASASCGISVRFEIESLAVAKRILETGIIKNFVRFYVVSQRFNQVVLNPIK